MPGKIQSAYYDTNVYIEATIGVGESYDYSLEVLQFASQKLLFCLGSPTVRRELKGAQDKLGIDRLLGVYGGVIHLEVPATKETRAIQARYIDALGIKVADALHLALASFNRADVLLSWNREDIVKPKTVRTVAEINARLGIPTPVILTPRDFVKRAKFSASRRSLLLD